MEGADMASNTEAATVTSRVDMDNNNNMEVAMDSNKGAATDNNKAEAMDSNKAEATDSNKVATDKVAAWAIRADMAMTAMARRTDHTKGTVLKTV